MLRFEFNYFNYVFMYHVKFVYINKEIEKKMDVGISLNFTNIKIEWMEVKMKKDDNIIICMSSIDEVICEKIINHT